MSVKHVKTQNMGKKTPNISSNNKYYTVLEQLHIYHGTSQDTNDLSCLSYCSIMLCMHNIPYKTVKCTCVSHIDAI